MVGPLPDDGIVITNEKIYEILMEVRDTVKPLPEKSADHEIRIRALERRMYLAAGGAGILGSLFGIFGAYLTNYVVGR